jgi:sigma-B regulation protein RsbU (phosphoserine phosphatase)
MPGTKSSGDFYDFVNAPNQRFVFALGDVARQGLEAVLLMTTLRTITHNAARFMTNANPRSVLLRANEDYIEDFSSGGRPATLFVAQFDPNRRELYYANAGHYPVIYCPLGGRARLLDADSPGLGANGKCTSENHVLRLEPGDLIVVASDGFVDAKSHNGEEFGLKRMLRLVEIVAEQSASEILTQMFDMLKDFCTGSRPEDDHSVLVVKGTAL